MQDRLSRLAIAFVCILVAALLAASALGLLGAALYLELLTLVVPPVAAALTAAAALLLAFLVLLVGRAVNGRRAGSPSRTGRGAGMAAPLGAAGLLGEEVGQAAGAFTRAHADKAIVAALVAGFALGLSPRLRRSLWRLLQ